MFYYFDDDMYVFLSGSCMPLIPKQGMIKENNLKDRERNLGSQGWLKSLQEIHEHMCHDYIDQWGMIGNKGAPKKYTY